MHELSPASPAKRVVFMKSTQIGGTECGNNWLGYTIHQAPVPFMLVQPSLNDARKVSRQRVSPMIQATPVLQNLVSDPKVRDSGNTILSKEFPGGILILTGANSDKGLRSTPAARLFLDEVDSYPRDVGGQGDPCALAEERTGTFPDRKVYLTSTPTIKGLSKIEAEFLESDQRHYFVPCPHCDHFQDLKWKNIKWDRDDTGRHLPETVRYECEFCGKAIDEFRHKTAMLARGEWRAKNPGSEIVGFHINGLYSPLGWVSWQEIVRKFLKAKLDPFLLRTWTNTVLAETWEDEVTKIDSGELMSRKETYGAPVPMGVGLLTAGVDVQADRLEVEVVGWGIGEESWHIEREVFYGDPAVKGGPVWTSLDDFLLKGFRHESGGTIRVRLCGVDSGYATDAVYHYTRGKLKRGILATKGVGAQGVPKPIISRPTRTNRTGSPVSEVGTITAKDAIYARLKIPDPGPGYCHFPESCDEEYFKQLTSEVVETTWTKGHAKREYVKARHARNEVLDCRVLAYAVLNLFTIDLRRYVERYRKLGEAGRGVPSKELQQETDAISEKIQTSVRGVGRGFKPRQRRRWQV